MEHPAYRATDNGGSPTARRETPMLRLTLVLFSLLTLALSAQARDQSTVRPEPQAPTAAEGANKLRVDAETDAAQAELANRQKRRDVLRDALRTQSEDAPATMRQMSLQQRQELRQQLRQQQEWLK